MLYEDCYIKTDVTYKLWKTYGPKDKTVEIEATVHLDNEERKVSLHGKQRNFIFENSDPYLVQAILDLMEKALELANQEKRVKYDGDDK